MTSAKSKAKGAAKADTQPPKQTLKVQAVEGKSEGRRLAEVSIDPAAHSLVTVQQFTNKTFGDTDVTDLYGAVSDKVKAISKGDLEGARALLAAQAISLNAIFTEMARRAGLNMGDYLQATQTYLRLALKAQAQSRSTIEALDRLTNGHVQTVKHVHVAEGGQAVIADEFHHHTGGKQIGRSDEQPHATGAAGAGPALSGPDPLGQSVPIPGGEREPTLQDARGEGKRRA